METHDHCSACFSRDCSFDLVKGVSCEVVQCVNACGQVLHQCKLEDHFQLCEKSVVDCVNESYGCPVEVQRCKMALHLKTCPANIIMCTMEWNRRDCASLIDQQNHKVSLQDMKGTASAYVDHDFDIACSAHDQRILLETIMPKEVLKYYSDLADLETVGRNELQIPMGKDPHPENNASVALMKVKEPPKCENIVLECVNESNLKFNSIEPPFSTKDGSTVESECNKGMEMKKISGDISLNKNAIAEDLRNSPLIPHDQSPSTNDNSPEKTVDTPEKQKKPGLLSKLRSRGLYFDYVGTGSSASISSLGWLPRKEYRHVGTDTDGLSVDKSTLEWLSPEVSLRQPDLISRIFSIIGSSSRRPALERTVSHYQLESSTQTVPPFLINVDMGCIGRQISNYLLYSSTIGIEEKHRMRALLMKGSESHGSYEEFDISNNLAFHSLGLNSAVDFFSRFSVLRRESWFASLASFMCGCILRRDQYAAHVKNVHSEIISGLNGWLEQKCPYYMYGCKFTSFRHSPGSRLNKLVYHHNLGSFAVTHLDAFDHARCNGDDDDDTMLGSHLVHLPYDALTHVFKYLDPFALNQLSLTCKYLREMCKSYLVTRGLVEMRWKKRDDMSPKWIYDKTIWYFPLAFTEIHWKFSNDPSMAVHLENCSVKAKQDCEVDCKTHPGFLLTKDAILSKSSGNVD